MAGNYMNAPASRLAYDRDGTIGVSVTASGIITQLTQADLQLLNDEAEGALTLTTRARLALVFPAPIDIEAIFWALSSSALTWTIETSKNTTTGIDGTWTVQVPAGTSFLKDVRPGYRIADFLTPMLDGSPSRGVRGIRFTTPSNVTIGFRALHIYGNLSSTATPDRLEFWSPSVDGEVSATQFDWGNVPRGSSADRTFRIKNMSSSLVAEGVEVYVESLTPGSPSVPGMLLFSIGGGPFAPSVTVGDLDPGEISPVITLRRNIPSNAQVSVWSARLVADVTSWTEA